MRDTTAYDPPLSGVRVLDLSSGPMTAIGRLLADLGARVTRVVLHGVTDGRTCGRVVDGVAIGTAIDRHGLETATAEPGSREWDRLLTDADILVETTAPGSPAEAVLDVRGLHDRHPELVILSISDFGRATTRRAWQATTPVFHALTGELSRSGIPGRDPLLPPGELPYHVASAQAAFQAVGLYLARSAPRDRPVLRRAHPRR